MVSGGSRGSIYPVGTVQACNGGNSKTVFPRQACGKVDHIKRSVCHVNLKTIR